MQIEIRQSGSVVARATLGPVPLIVGRDQGADLHVDNPTVSSRHLDVRLIGGRCIVRDLGSTNGSWLRGQRLVPNVEQNIVAGDALVLGSAESNFVELTIAGVAASATGPSGNPSQAAAETAGEAMQQGSRTFAVAHEGRLTIGRNPDSDIHLPSPSVSWNHAVIERRGGRAEISDPGSTNGTWVEGVRISGKHPLQAGEAVKIGMYELRFDGETLTPWSSEDGMRVDAIQVTKEVGSGASSRQILKDISLTVHPHEFVALLGPSGAGKSTLLKTICGADFDRDGWVLVNQDELSQSFDMYRTQVGYVPQDDIIHGQLTARSALTHAARLRLPSDTTSTEIRERVDAALATVELLGREDVPINSLSGGQRKRVSIAVELLAEPRLMFLDEPTSGLDPGLDRKMMEMLRNLAQEGRTVVLVTHATTNLDQCDLICLLARGRVVYYGPPEEAFGFFGVDSHTYSEIYSLVDAGDPEEAERRSLDWHQRYTESRWHRRYVMERNAELHRAPAPTNRDSGPSRRRSARLRQLAVLTRRYSELVVRDRFLMVALLLVMPLIGGLVGAISDPHWLTGVDECVAECIDDGPPDAPEAPPRAPASLSDRDLFDASELPSGSPEIFRDAILCLDRQEMSRRASIAELDSGDLTRGACPSPDGKADEASVGAAGYTVAPDAQRIIFNLALAAVLLGIFAASFEIVRERAIYTRERMVNLSIWSYVLSKFLVLSVFAAVQAAALLGALNLAGVAFPEASGPVMGVFPELYITVYLATLAAISTGLLVSVLTPSRDAVMYLVLVVLFFQITFSGGVFDLGPGLEPVSWLNVTRWAMEGLGGTINMESISSLGRFAIESAPGGHVAVVPTPFESLHDYSSSAEHQYRTWGILAGFSFVGLFATVGALAWKERR